MRRKGGIRSRKRRRWNNLKYFGRGRRREEGKEDKGEEEEKGTVKHGKVLWEPMGASCLQPQSV